MPVATTTRKALQRFGAKRQGHRKKDEADLRAESAATSARRYNHRKALQRFGAKRQGAIAKKDEADLRAEVCPLLQAPVATTTRKALQRFGAERQEYGQKDEADLRAESAVTSARRYNHQKGSPAV